MAPHSSILAWRIPGTEEPGGLPSMERLRVRHNWNDLAAACKIGSHGNFLYDSGTQTGTLWQAEGWDGEGDGREVWEGGDMDLPMADSYWCMTENYKIL